MKIQKKEFQKVNADMYQDNLVAHFSVFIFESNSITAE